MPDPVEPGAHAVPAATGGLRIEEDRARGLILVFVSGFWTPPQIDAHFARLKPLVRAHRAIHGTVRVLVDLRQSEVQAGDTVDQIGSGIRATYQPGDRVAIVVAASLAKLQMRRIVCGNLHAFFVSTEAAQLWLEAR